MLNPDNPAESGNSDEDQNDETLLGGEGSGEGSSEGSEGGDGKASGSSDGSGTTVPEKYEITLPENSLLGEDAIDKVAAYAKEQGLSNKQAQALLEREDTIHASIADSQNSSHQQLVESWKQEAAKDSEFGGVNFDKNLNSAKQVVNRFGSEKLRQAMDDSGLGNHPELIRMLVRIGSAMSTDTLEMGGSQSKKPRAPEDVLYDAPEGEKEGD